MTKRQPNPSDPSDLGLRSAPPVEPGVRELIESGELPPHAADQLREMMQDLEVHRMGLEMQNRALHETQTQLEASVQRYADLYDHLPVGYVTVSSSGQIVHANLLAAELLRRDRMRLAGSPFRAFLDAYDAGRFAAHLDNCMRSGRPSVIDLTLRLKSDASLVVQLSSRLAPPNAGEAHVHIAITDVSQLKQAQRVLEEINREQEAFNYSISHDLRAPLVTINNYAGIVLEEHGDKLDDEGRGMIERMRCAALRMEETLKQLLEYSTLGREQVALEPVNAESVIADLLIAHRVVIRDKNATVEVDRPLPRVMGAREILGQVLANLLTNALKYTQPDQPPCVRISAESRDPKVVIKVRDQGIGIDAKYHERIFRVFERLHGYSRYPGSGVGLAIARRAAEKMKGRLWVESEPGKGTCFCLELSQV